MAHWGHLGVLGQGWTTGHQNSRPAHKKETCSNLCSQSHRNASSNTAGICHPIKASVRTSQQIVGLKTMRPNLLVRGDRRNGLTTPRASDCGSPRSSGNSGAPSKSRGGAMAARSRCCTIWIVSDTSSNASSGEPIAIQTVAKQAKKSASRRVEIGGWLQSAGDSNLWRSTGRQDKALHLPRLNRTTIATKLEHTNSSRVLGGG